MSADLLPVFQPLADEDPRKVGGYRLHARLGAGGMGRVYLAYTPGGRPVALKVVRPELAEDEEFSRRFTQEVASARRIHGLYTAQVVDSGPDWLATAYVPGPSLQQVVRGQGPLPERTVLLLIGGIAEALQVIHAAGVVHRDLKPANVLIATDGPRVIDFGIARAADAEMLTATGVRIGSPAFMAPEQAQGLSVTPATDVWALGALAAYVAGGVSPFGEGPHTTVLYRVVHEQPQLDRVPDSLRGLLLHCLAKRPEDRPTPAELIAAASVHPAMGGQLRFTEDWLPQEVTLEIGRRATLPEPAPTAEGDRARPASRPTLPLQRRGGPKTPAGRPRLSRKTVLVLAAAAVLVAGAAGTGTYLLTRPAASAGTSTDRSSPSTDTTADTAVGPSPETSAAGYTEVYSDREVTTNDSGYDFDIATAKPVPQKTTKWYIGRNESEFYWTEDSDAFSARDAALTPAGCLQGIENHPADGLNFADLPPGSSFCVRSRTTQDIAIAKVVSLSHDGGPVTITLDYFRHQG